MKDQTKAKERSKRITAHNKLIREGRALGLLKPLGTQTYNQILKSSVYDTATKKQIRQITENGSVLPNKWARWEYPFDQYSELDY